MKRYAVAIIALFVLAATAGAGRFFYLQSSFNAGELSPKVYGRVDLEKYANGCKTLKNFVPLPHGGVERRPGFEYIGDANVDGENVRLIPFIFSDEQAYVLEFMDGDITFWTNDGQVQTVDANTDLLLHMDGADGSTTFTDDGDTGHTVTANGDAQIDTAQYKFESGSGHFTATTDYISIADHADWAFSTGNFTIDLWVRFDEPSGANSTNQTFFYQYNSATDYQLFEFDATSSTQGKFKYTTVDGAALIAVETSALTITEGEWYHIAVIRGWDGNANDWAITVNGVSQGTDTDSDGVPDVAASVSIGGRNGGGYVHGRIDEMRISKGTARWTANFTPPTLEYPDGDDSGTAYQVTSTGYTEDELAEIQYAQSYDVLYLVHPDNIPNKLSRTNHTSWTLADSSSYCTDCPGDWGAADYPRAIAFYQDRLWYAGSASYPARLWASNTAAYDTFTDIGVGTNDDDPIAVDVLGHKVEVINWLSPTRKLVVGTSEGEWWVYGEDADTGGITPTVIGIQRDTGFGAIHTMPVLVGNTIIYAQEPGDKMRTLQYEWESDSFDGKEISILAEHLLDDDGIKEVHYQRAPYQIIWIVTDDGDLLSLTYMAEHEVVAWAEHELGGTDVLVKSACVIPGDTEDRLWIAVERTVNSATATTIERLAKFDHMSAIASARYRDSYLVYDGSAATSISGLDHLEGETLEVLADGVVVNGVAVSSGAVTLTSAASEVCFGLSYDSQLETIYVEVPSQAGSTMFEEKKLIDLNLRVRNSAGGQFGYGLSSMKNLNVFNGYTDTALYTGDITGLSLGRASGYEPRIYASIQQSDPLPLNVDVIGLRVEVNE